MGWFNYGSTVTILTSGEKVSFKPDKSDLAIQVNQDLAAMHWTRSVSIRVCGFHLRIRSLNQVITATQEVERVGCMHMYLYWCKILCRNESCGSHEPWTMEDSQSRFWLKDSALGRGTTCNLMPTWLFTFHRNGIFQTVYNLQLLWIDERQYGNMYNKSTVTGNR